MPRTQRILLVEDDPRMASMLADLLEEADFAVDGPYATLSDGVAALASHFPDGAVLDIRLKDRDAGLLADDLDNYDIPYLFCSGGQDERIAAQHVCAPMVQKPYVWERLVPTLRRILS